MTFYAYNGPYKVLRTFKTGSHVGDWEHLTARLDPHDGHLQGVWYNSHRNRDGMWVKGPQVPRTREGRIMACVALHGHGTYPKAGTIPRHFLLANDSTCCDERKMWQPQVCRWVDWRPWEKRPLEGNSFPPLMMVESRGCALPPIRAKERFCEDLAESSAVEVLVDPAPWLQFQGFFGTAACPSQQNWFTRAEPPVSRGGVKRVIGHWMPEVQRI